MQKFIKSSLDYIEKNLKTDIAADELAQMASYSVWHYCRLFSQIIGSSVANYILKRRLDHALAEISSGRKAIDVILEYGFDTYAGFYKAFVKIYGCSPKKYLSIYKNHTIKNLEVKIMYNEKDLRKILENWDIPKDIKIENIYVADNKTISESAWKIGEYTLKTASREAIIKNIKIAKALDKQGFSAAVPVLTKSGAEYLDGENIFMLAKTIKGEPLEKQLRFNERREEFGFKYGQSISKLHKALKIIQKDLNPDESNLYQTCVEWALPIVKKQNQQFNMNISEDFFEDYIGTFGNLYEKLPRQLIHRDIHPGNILFDNDNVVGFIEFDISECNIRLIDPCYCSTGLLSEQADLTDPYSKWIDVLAGIMKGYNSINILTDEEKQAVFYVICSIEMIFTAWFDGNEEWAWMSKINREMFVYIIKNKDNIMNIF